MSYLTLQFLSINLNLAYFLLEICIDFVDRVKHLAYLLVYYFFEIEAFFVFRYRCFFAYLGQFAVPHATDFMLELRNIVL